MHSYTHTESLSRLALMQDDSMASRMLEFFLRLDTPHVSMIVTRSKTSSLASSRSWEATTFTQCTPWSLCQEITMLEAPGRSPFSWNSHQHSFSVGCFLRLTATYIDKRKLMQAVTTASSITKLPVQHSKLNSIHNELSWQVPESIPSP